MLPASYTNVSFAFSPCQITGFFQIHDQNSDPSRKGSTGAGVNVADGIRTSVRVRKSSKNHLRVLLNKHDLVRPLVSKRVVDEYLGFLGGRWDIHVEHRCKLPVGAGYGTSGAGALSLSLALNDAFGETLPRQEALRIAHVADAQAKTGLGTVASESIGGLAVRISPGAPGIGKVRKLATSSKMRVVSGSFGPMSKNRVLSSEALRRSVNVCSRGLVDNLLRNRDVSSFMVLSRRFADCLDLMSSRLRDVLIAMNARGIVASMMMLGEGAFCIIPKNAAPGVARLLRDAGMRSAISRISTRGAHLL